MELRILLLVAGFAPSALLPASELSFFRCTTSFLSEKDADPFATPSENLDTPRVVSVVPQFSQTCVDIRKPFREVGIEAEVALHFEDIGLVAVRASEEMQKIALQYFGGTHAYWPRLLDIEARIECPEQKTVFFRSVIPARSGQRVSSKQTGAGGSANFEYDPTIAASGNFCGLNFVIEATVQSTTFRLSSTTILAFATPDVLILGLHPDGSGDTITATFTAKVRNIAPAMEIEGSTEKLVKKAIAAKLAK